MTGAATRSTEMRRLEWRGKVEPDIRPDMSAKQVREQLALAAGNAGIKKLVTLWSLVAEGGDGGRIADAPQRGRARHPHGGPARGRRKGWEVPTLICDATGDAELLRTIWPELKRRR